MRISHVMASGARGGGAAHLLGLCRALQGMGVRQLSIVGDDGPLADQLDEVGVCSRRLAMMRRRVDPLMLWRLRRYLDVWKPDVVHVHGTRAGFAVALLNRKEPWVYTVHGLSFRKGRAYERLLFGAAEALVCRRATQVISVCAADLEELEQRGWARASRATHIPNAVPEVRRRRSRSGARKRIGLPEQAFVVGTVSRLVPQKAVADLIAAVSGVQRATLVVIGDGPQRKELELLAQSSNVTAVFLGSRDDVAQLLPALDVFALSSHWEGEPVALLEAMAAGLPCVATATGGAVELLSESGAGLLVDIGAPARLAGALRQLEQSPQKRRELGCAGRRFARGRTFSHMARATIRIYEQALRRS